MHMFKLFLMLLTILTEVINNNNSTEQIRWCPVNDTVYGAEQHRQSFFVEADYDSRCWQLGWVCVMFGLTTGDVRGSHQF